MEPNLFRNRWLALAFVGLVLVGAMALVGSEDEGGLLDRFMREEGREPEVVERLGGERAAPSPELLATSPEGLEAAKPVTSFASDEELIDDTQGFATTPVVIHDGPDGAMPEIEDETIIIETGEPEPGF